MLNLLNTLPKRLATLLGLAAMILCAGAMDRPPPSSHIRIIMEQQDSGSLLVTYELDRFRKDVAFSEISGRYRKKQWKLVTPDFRIVNKDDQDVIERADGEKFDRVVLIASPSDERLAKEYQPIARYGEGGVMVYTGHFWPMTPRGARISAAFTFRAQPGAKVVAFGERADELRDWQSPLGHPAFVYMGPLAPVETPQVMAVVDPDAPKWIIDEFYDLTPRAFKYLSDEFGFSLAAKPNLFLAAPLGKDEGRLSYAGDALPEQFQITLVGAAWKNKTQQALDIFRSSTVHEAVHLWQAAARPGADDVAAWIHEGAADAIAAEALVAIGDWDDADLAEYFLDARDECARGLRFGSLSSAGKRRNYRAMYACGHVIAEAVSIAENMPIADFWRTFVQRAQNGDGYSEKMYFDLVQERTGDPIFTRELRYFVHTPLANPDREIGRLLGLASVSTGAHPLASPEGG